MRINLVFPNLYTPLSFSPALQILSAVLKKAGHEVFLTHIHEKKIPNNDDDIIFDITKNKPDLVGFTSTSFEYNRVDEIAGELRDCIDAPIILGGVHATISPEDFEESNFDAFVIGEGEKIIIDIANGKIKPEGILYGETLKDLDTLPFFDWDIFDSQEIIDSKNGWLDISLSRGCPFNCAFCANAALMKIKKINRIRKRSVDNSISELKYLISKFKIVVISFADDEFLLDKKWLYEFLERFKNEIKLGFKIEARVDTINDKTAKLLKESGCFEIQFGVESGSERIREFLYKRVNNDKIIKAFDLCRKYKINTYTYIMIGIPTETIEDLEMTMSLLARLKPNLIRPTFLCPVKGTYIYKYCIDKDLIKRDITVWNYESPLELKDIDNNILKEYWYNFPDKINKYMKGKWYYKYKDEPGVGTSRFNRLELHKHED